MMILTVRARGPGGAGGGAGQFILFLMLKVRAVRRPRAETRDPGGVVTTITRITLPTLLHNQHQHLHGEL